MKKRAPSQLDDARLSLVAHADDPQVAPFEQDLIATVQLVSAVELRRNLCRSVNSCSERTGRQAHTLLALESWAGVIARDFARGRRDQRRLGISTVLHVACIDQS